MSQSVKLNQHKKTQNMVQNKDLWRQLRLYSLGYTWILLFTMYVHTMFSLRSLLFGLTSINQNNLNS